MLTMDDAVTIKQLQAEGLSVRAIARHTGHARNTVRKILRNQHEFQSHRPSRTSKLDPYKAYLQDRYGQYQLSAVRLLAEVQALGYTGSIGTLRRYLHTLKAPERLRQQLTVRYETPPGKQAQVDWADCGRFCLASGDTLHLFAFVMVLSYSRMMYVRFTPSTKLAALLTCHQQAFEYFGGWPATILYDNMKQIRLSRSSWNESFLDFANHYGFVPKTHRPYRPRTKGKVERMVDYVKDNFLAGRTFTGLDDLNHRVLTWLADTANVRQHGTTGAVPQHRLEDEALTPIQTVPPYTGSVPVMRTVTREAMVQYQGSRYSVPPTYAGQPVTVRAHGGLIHVRQGDMIVAEHPQALQRGECRIQKDHVAELWKLSLAHADVPVAPSGLRWHLQEAQAVEQVPLTRFEELSA